MIGRRDVMGGGVLASLTALLSPGTAEARQSQSEGDTRRIVEAIDKLREAIERQQDSCFLGPCSQIKDVRTAQHVFLKANQKYPDFVDVGTDIWHAVFDWHIKNRLPLGTTRLPDGRYGLAFMFTTLVMRPENPGSYISYGYDAK